MNRRQIVCALSLAIFVSLVSVNCGNGEDSGPISADNGNWEVDLFPHKPEGSEFWGYRDGNTGAMVIEPRFDQAREFLAGLAAVKINGMWGYIDKTGKTVVSPQFWEVRYPSEGLAAVMDFWTQKWGYIDKTGKYVIEPQFTKVENFSEGLAAVRINEGDWLGMWGYIDKTGKYVIEPQFGQASSFSEGLAAARKRFLPYRHLATVPDELWGYIDKTGKYVIGPQFQNASRFIEGLASVGFPEDCTAWRDRLSGQSKIDCTPGVKITKHGVPFEN